MTRTDTSAWPCTIARAADVLGDGWNLLILRQACLGTRRSSFLALPLAPPQHARLLHRLRSGLRRACSGRFQILM